MDNPRKILVIQLKRAGDVILTTPIPAVLKTRWPQARVDFLVEKAFAPLLENNPSIDGIQIYDKQHIVQTLKMIRAQRYDTVLDFQSSPRSAIIVLASGARETGGYKVPFWGHFYQKTVRRPNSSQTVVRGKVSLAELFIGAVSELPTPKIYLTVQEQTWAKSLSLDERGRPWVGIIPTHRRTSRRWQAESFAEVARQLDESGFTVLLFWGPGERDYVENLLKIAPKAKLIPPTSLRQMAALLGRCQWVVTNDNGPMHMAAAVGTPTVTIYGPTDPYAWNPGGPRHQVVQASGVSCLGCNLNECPFGHECMTQLVPQQVIAACDKLQTRVSEEMVV